MGTEQSVFAPPPAQFLTLTDSKAFSGTHVHQFFTADESSFPHYYYYYRTHFHKLGKQD